MVVKQNPHPIRTYQTGQNLRKSDSEALLRSADRIFHLNPMPGVIHITLEIPNLSGILWLAIPGTIPCPHDNL